MLTDQRAVKEIGKDTPAPLLSQKSVVAAAATLEGMDKVSDAVWDVDVTRKSDEEERSLEGAAVI